MPLQTNVIGTIIGTAERLNALPKATKKEWDRLQALKEKVRNLDLPTYSLSRAALVALEADSDLMSDPDVNRAVVSRAINESRAGITAELDSQVVDFIDTHGSGILESLRKPFNAAAERIGRCLDTLGDVSLDDTAATLKRGGDAAQVWVDARGADQTIASIATATKLMRRFPLDNRYQLLIIADLDPAQFLDDQLTGVKMSAWDVARRGYLLSLASPTELDERVAAIATEMQQREAHARGGLAREYRRTHGDGLVVR